MSVWLLSSPYGRSDFWWCECVCTCVSVFACMCMCRTSVCGCVCVCTSTVDNFCVCTACLCPLWKTGRFLSPPGVFLLLYICARACVVTLAQVVRLHDSRYSYGVLTCADAWPVWEREAAGVRGETLDLDCESFWRTARFDRCLHNALDVPFQLWISGIFWFRCRFLLSVHVCDLFPRSVPPALLICVLCFWLFFSAGLWRENLIGCHLVRNFPNSRMWLSSLWKVWTFAFFSFFSSQKT